MNSRANRIERYRNKATKIRLLAESMRAPANMDLLLHVAEDYLNLATTLDNLATVGEHSPNMLHHP